MFGYADGFTDNCSQGTTNSRSAVATITHQSSGTGLFAS